MIVLDTNVVSELMRATPSRAVLRWLDAMPSAELRTTTVTLAEVRYGIACLPDGRRKSTMRATADEAFAIFTETMLPFDTGAAEEYADIAAARKQAGWPVDMADAQIAAICRATGSVLATRNGTDFAGTAVDVVDPWSDG